MSKFDFAGLTAPFVLLEDRLSPKGRALLYVAPREIVTCSDLAGVEAALARLEAGLALGLYAAGFMAYELGLAFEPHLQRFLPEKSDAPLLWFGLFDAPRVLDAEALDAAFASLAPPAPLQALQFGTDQATHMRRVEKCLDYLNAGDAYQINLTLDIAFKTAQPLQVYAAMRAGQPVAHGALINTGTEMLLSVSPELFLQAAHGEVMTRPMKGTARRGSTPAEDAAQISTLQNDPKQRAENIMIVDLMRNDLSRIAEIGSVTVSDLLKVETYPSFHTLTSTISAKLKAKTGFAQLMKAIFPCGSITGAPKHRAMEIIHELEGRRRDIYTGSIGQISPNGQIDLNVAIRTARILPNGEGHYGVGGGIVLESDPVGEYEEALLKARILTNLASDYGLIETLRWTAADGFVRAQRHLDRLERSAALLGFVFDRAAVSAALAEAAAGFNADMRVRLELARSGVPSVTFAALGPEPERKLRVGLASQRLDRANPFLRHKTTKRGTYAAALSAAQARGLDEALFLNAQGFICEASFNSIFVARGDVLLTPPLVHGLLPGILREELLAEGRAIEYPLRLEDIQGREFYLGNSLRGLRAAELVN